MLVRTLPQTWCEKCGVLTLESPERRVQRQQLSKESVSPLRQDIGANSAKHQISESKIFPRDTKGSTGDVGRGPDGGPIRR